MNIKTILTGILISFTFLSTFANEPIVEEKKSDTNIVGHVVCGTEHVPFASIMIKGTTIGTTTDATGHFQLINMPSGKITTVVSMVGYKTNEQEVTLIEGKTTELKFELKEDILNLDEVVISADRNAQKRTDAAVIVNTISPKLFNTSQSLTLGEGLNFSPGLRLENNCQNCGFSQVRMNGMEGPYSQILINNRPIFSGLAGVYGLELLPATMIERVEVVRGGGSALFGSNAIAGTINIILKDPITNSYEGGVNYALTGVGMEDVSNPASDQSINFNASVVSDDSKSGLSLYGFSRKRKEFDANDDTFSEIAMLENITFGARAFHRIGYRSKVVADFFAIHEERAGGNEFDKVYHERDIAEAVTHDMKVGALTYERFFREYDKLTAYASGQFLDRDSYYGANQSLDSYGLTKDITYNTGVQYKALFGDNGSLVTGIENTGGFLVDQKLGYLDVENAIIIDNSIDSIPHTDNVTIADQSSITTGAFAQYDIRINRLKVSAGLRLDHYSIKDLTGATETKSGNVLSPRLSFMYDASSNLQFRTSYSQGYRAPQIFDEDLHIETSGSRQVIHVNDPDLQQESSHSFMLSADYNKMIGNVYVGLLVEGFYTNLVDAFTNEIGVPDADNVVTYKRVNAEGGATVQGVNLELKIKPMKNFGFTSGFTVQTSEFAEPEDIFNETRFFRTPNTYGFIALDWDFYKNFCLAATGNYTGSMLVPHNDIELIESEAFYDFGTKISYKHELNSASVEFSAGIKNILNSYQSDFDKGIDRDPAYMYGPTTPRTIYFGIKFGNLL